MADPVSVQECRRLLWRLLLPLLLPLPGTVLTPPTDASKEGRRLSLAGSSASTTLRMETISAAEGLLA